MSPDRQIFLAVMGGCMSLAVCVSGAASAATKPAAKPDLTGVWIGTSGSDPQWRSTPWLPTPVFTPAGAIEAEKQASFITPGECQPWTPVWFMNATPLFPLEIAKSGDNYLLLMEAAVITRHIYVDGRAHPADLDSTWLGHSVGHWEGDVLVVDTIGTNGRARPMNGYIAGAPMSRPNDPTPRLPASDRLHVVERIRLVGGGDFLEDEIAVTDPKFYTGPFSTKHYWQRRPDIDVQEYFCEDNNRQPDAKAQAQAGR